MTTTPGDGPTSASHGLAERVLHESRQLGVIHLDVQGHVTRWNHGSEFITGFAAADVIGKHFGFTFTAEDLARQVDQLELVTARTLGASDDERWHVRRDGSRYWASGTTLAMKSDGVLQGYFKVFKDVTHLRSRMKLLENEADALARELADRELHLGTIAHELRNPLLPIRSVAAVLKKQDPDGRHASLVKILERQVGYLDRLVEDLVDITRVKTGKLALQHQVVPLQRLLASAIDELRDDAQQRGVSLQLLAPAAPIEVEVDEARLHQVVSNLLTNALKFTPSGGLVTVLANVEHDHFLVHVKDTGKGIGPELLPKIFDMFTQAQPRSSERGAGLGIGLALVKEIVALHAGTVEVRSEGPGKGSEFIVRMPLKPRAARSG
jgi:two-component system CheB/CheR fusion protein